REFALDSRNSIIDGAIDEDRLAARELDVDLGHEVAQLGDDTLGFGDVTAGQVGEGGELLAAARLALESLGAVTGRGQGQLPEVGEILADPLDVDTTRGQPAALDLGPEVAQLGLDGRLVEVLAKPG